MVAIQTKRKKKKKEERENWLQGQPLQHRGYFHAPMLEGHEKKVKSFVVYLFFLLLLMANPNAS